MDDIGQDCSAAVAAALDHGRGGLVAGGFDPQHQDRLVVIRLVVIRLVVIRLAVISLVVISLVVVRLVAISLVAIRLVVIHGEPLRYIAKQRLSAGG